RDATTLQATGHINTADGQCWVSQGREKPVVSAECDSNSSNQTFSIISVGTTGSILIQSSDGQLCLDTAKADVQMFPCNDNPMKTKYQVFNLGKPLQQGQTIQNLLSGSCIDMVSGSLLEPAVATQS
ncbi:hypothetical protein HDU99_007168, partial [Rhizoclosmatium hyalinum]